MGNMVSLMVVVQNKIIEWFFYFKAVSYWSAVPDYGQAFGNG